MPEEEQGKALEKRKHILIDAGTIVEWMNQKECRVIRVTTPFTDRIPPPTSPNPSFSRQTRTLCATEIEPAGPQTSDS